MSSLSFLNEVKLWKFAAASLWAGVIYILFIFLIQTQNFIFSSIKSKFSFYLHFPLLEADIFLYMISLTVLPTPSSVLQLKNFAIRFSWFLTHLLFVASFFMHYTSVAQSLFYAFFSAFILSQILPFSIFIPEFVFKKAKRLSRLDVLTSTYRFPKVAIMFHAVLFFAFDFLSLLFHGHISHCFIPGLLLFFASDIISRICEIIAGEPVSFASKGTRITDGMKSKEELTKFYAYTDFFLSASDDCNTRRKQMFHMNVYNEIVNALREQITSYLDTYVFYEIQDTDPDHRSISRTNDQTLNKDQKRRILNTVASRQEDKNTKLDQASAYQRAEISKQENSPFNIFLKKIGLYNYVIRLKDIILLQKSEADRRKNEINAVKDSVEMIEMIRAVHFLVYSADKESDDVHGYLQSRIEEIVDSFLSMSRILKNVPHQVWVDVPFQGVVPRYNADFIARNPADITLKVYEFVHAFLKQFLDEYSTKIDDTKISDNNRDEYNFYLL